MSHCPDFIPAKRRLAILSAANPGDNQKADDLATKARGIIIYRRGDFARAGSLLKECSKRSNDDAGLMHCLGTAQRRLQQSAESAESLQRALALNLRGDPAEVARRILAEKQGWGTFWIANGNARP